MCIVCKLHESTKQLKLKFYLLRNYTDTTVSIFSLACWCLCTLQFLYTSSSLYKRVQPQFIVGTHEGLLTPQMDSCSLAHVHFNTH